MIFEAAMRCFLDGFEGGLLFVVDNSEKPLASPLFGHPRVKYSFAARNLGFGAGHNLALSLIKQLPGEPAQGHLFLNPDVTFGPQVLPELVTEMLLDPRMGAVMPQILFADGQLQRLSKLLPTPADLLLRRFLPVRPLVEALNRRYELFDLPQDSPQEVPSLSGCFLLVRSSLLKQVGGFDERYFMYMEDVDLVRRIGDHARTMYIPSVFIIHGYGRGSYQNPKLLGYHLRSACIYFYKWGWWFDPVRRERNRRTLNRLRYSAVGARPVDAAATAESPGGREPAGAWRGTSSLTEPPRSTHLRVAVAAGSGRALAQHARPLLTALREIGCRPVMFGPLDEATEQLITEGFDFVELPSEPSMSRPWLALTRVLALRRALKAGCLDAAFTFTATSNMLYGLAALGLKLPHVPTLAHGQPAASNDDAISPWLRGLYRRSMRAARWIVVPGEHAASWSGGNNGTLERGSQHVQRLLHIPAAGVDLEHFALAPWPVTTPAQCGHGPRFLMIVSDLFDDHDVADLIAATRQLKAHVPNAVVRCLGPMRLASNGRAAPDPWTACAAEGLLEHLGSPQDLRPAIAASDAVVLPRYGEDVKIILLQAAAMGRPCIVCDAAGFGDVVENNVTGLACSTRNADSIAQTMVRFAGMPSTQWQAMGEAARRMVEHRFDLQGVKGTYAQLATRLAAEANQRRAA